MKIPKLLILLLLIAGLTSCGLFKKVSIETDSSKIKTSVDSIHSSTVKDQSTITITEKIDTVVHTKPIHIEAVKPVVIDSTGIVTAELDSLMLKIRVSYNALTKSVSFDVKKLAELIPVKLHRVTFEQRNIDRADNGRVKKAIKVKTDNDQKVKEPDYGALFTLIGSVAFVLFCIWLFLKYKASRLV